MRDLLLIVNPIATNVTEARTAAVERELARVAHVTTVHTERKRHATELARGAQGADAVVVFSGDGGFNEVLNGVDANVHVGFVPGGGTSVLPRALGLPRDPLLAAQRVAEALATGRPARNAYRGHDLDRVEVRCDMPLPLQADGEDLGDVTEAVFEAERRAVRVLV